MSQEICALYIIINAGHAEDVMELARAAGAKGATILNARGGAAVQKTLMGITVDAEKEILLILVDKATADGIMIVVKEKAGVQTPAQGVCFTVPVEQTTLINQFPEV